MTKPDTSIPTRKLSSWIAVLLPICVFSVLFVGWYVRHERYIYFWDYVGYHDLYADLGSRFMVSPWRALHYLLTSIRTSDYNALPVFPLVPFWIAFGSSRLAYILAVTVTYVLPLMVVFPLVVSRLAGNPPAARGSDNGAIEWMTALVLAASPILWMPVLLGLPDVGGLVVLYLILLLYLRSDFAEQSRARAVTLGLLLCVLVLFRRWYAYWVIGFFAALILCEGIRALAERDRWGRLTKVARNILTIGGVSLVSYLIIATPVARRILATNYGDIYSAYRSSQPIAHNLKMVYEHFGPLILVLAAVGIAVSARIPERRPAALFLCVQLGITFVLFTRTQDLGYQHFYWVLATVAVFAALAARDVFLWIPFNWGKAAFLVLSVGVFLSGFASSFVPSAGRWLAVVRPALPQATLYPRVRTDLAAVWTLLDVLGKAGGDPDATIYILSSSFGLNSSLVHEACLHLDPPHRQLARRIAATNDIDKRDGFPTQMLEARYVVLTVPFGYHLAPQDQKVIGVLAEQIVRKEGIGASYEKLDYEFPLYDGSSALIYKKVRPIHPDALRALSDAFVGFYPDYRSKFEIPQGAYTAAVLP